MSSPEDGANYFRNLSSKLKNLQPISSRVAEETKEFIDERFARGIDVDGSPFRPLSPATLSIDPSRAGGIPLTKTGNLKNSISVVGNADGIQISAPLKYTNAQNFGNPRNRVFGGPLGPVPARPFLPYQKDLNLIGTGQAGAHWERMRQLILDWLLDGDIS
jgi:phage gpG-like protein